MTVKDKVLLGVLLLLTTSIYAQVGFRMETGQSIIEVTQPELTKADSGYGKESLPVYRTLTIIQYDRVNVRLDLITQQIQRMQAELDSNTTDTAHLFTDAEFNRRKDSIESLNRIALRLEDESDSLYYEYVREYVDYKRFTGFPGPLRARAIFDQVYGNGGQKFKAMGNAGVQFGSSGTASIYSEVVSGNMGMVRVAFGTMLTSDDSGNDSTAQAQQAYQRLIANGGNTVLSLEYPLFYGSWYKGQVNTIVRPMIKGSADFPAFGTSTDKWAGCGMFGIDGYFDFATDNNQIRFFINANSFYVRGTDIYQSNLGVTSPDFSFGQATVGVVFLENFKLSVIIGTWSTQAVLRKSRVAIGGQVLR